MRDQPDVSIIIVTFNVAGFLDSCLRSIRQETRSRHEIIVVDNSSRDGSAEIARSVAPEAVIFRNERNLGFSRANNQGFCRARGRHLFMLNPDTVVRDRAIDRLVAFMDEHPEAGACGPKNLNPDLSLQQNCHHFPTLSSAFFDALQLRRFFPGSRIFGREQMTYWGYDDVREVDWITGCSLMLRKQALDQVGFLDERYFMYAEECDLCFRLKKNHWRVFFEPSAAIIHYYGRSALSHRSLGVHEKNITRYYFESRYYFFEKNYGRGRGLLLRALDSAYYGSSLIKNGISFSRKDRDEKIACAQTVIRSALNLG